MSDPLLNFAARLRAYMRESLASPPNEEQFNSLALELFSIQRERNSAYAKICASRSVKSAVHWWGIPSVPTVAFKELEMTSLPPGDRKHVFHSSGTTQQERSRHFHSNDSISLYEESLRLWFDHNFTSRSAGHAWLFLTPPASAAPTSSLAHMFATIAERVNEAHFVGLSNPAGWESDVERAIALLRKTRKPLAILGTAFLFVHLLDELRERRISFQLPANSWLMETGGYKGRSRIVPKEELRAELSQRLGVAPTQIFSEYGMSELSSQAYDRADGLFRFPPWARAQIISPATGRAANPGERGLIRVYDLANVWSVMAVQTEDVGISDGDAFALSGRAEQAEARGCSLMSAG